LATLGARIFARRPLRSNTLFVKRDWAPIELTHGTETLLRPLSPAWLPRIDDSAQIIINIFVFVVSTRTRLARHSVARVARRGVARRRTILFAIHRLAFVFDRRSTRNAGLFRVTLASSTAATTASLR